ncbi:MAG: methyltransferase domain-containing protein [Kofleriaceae bacterium]
MTTRQRATYPMETPMQSSSQLALWRSEFGRSYTDRNDVAKPRALVRARNPEDNVMCATAFDLPFKDGFADLAFTSGVLIHIAPADLAKAMAEIYRVSRRYIVAIEYDAPIEQEIQYRGNGDSLWKRDHGGLWQAAYPSLKLLRRLECFGRLLPLL